MVDLQVAAVQIRDPTYAKMSTSILKGQ